MSRLSFAKTNAVNPKGASSDYGRDIVAILNDMHEIATTAPYAAAANGVVNVGNTTPVVGTFYALTAVVDTVFSAITETGATGAGPIAITIPAGVTLLGTFTGFTLTSGFVRAYISA